MKVLLDNIEVSKELFAVNDGLNYGRFFNNDNKNIKYNLPVLKLLN